MRKLALLIVAAVGLTATSRASAQPACNSLPDEPAAGPIPKLYIENGDTQEPLVKTLGKLLVKSAQPLRVIYRNRPTCNIRRDMFSNTPMYAVTDGATARTVRYIHANPDEDSSECTVPAQGSADPADPIRPIQLGIGATYLTSCTDEVPANPDLAVLDGPIQAYGFIAHKNSTQNGITAEEGYLAYGFTEGLGEANPWVVQALRFKRSNTASTTLTMAAAIRLTATDLKTGPALSPETSLQLIAEVAKDEQAEARLGILGMDLYDVNRDKVKVLPFKSFGQRFAYYPDKTSTSFDKQNVRDGHYLPWSPTPYMALKDAAGNIADPNAKRFYELVRGFRTDPDVDGLLAVAQNGLTPECAMTVTRAGDGADLEPYDDPTPCGCYYEKNVKSGSTTCTACANDGPCGGGKCRFGFCEAK
ncbi:MAG: hypothetical protein KIT84_38940 [Labilithrix sp.]|nr:hypothetical protein [Labilithrix sp.]MCW5817039.1 hypothetical protein [Labilithrix sp.]